MQCPPAAEHLDFADRLVSHVPARNIRIGPAGTNASDGLQLTGGGPLR
jgi:hypothetical protein